MCMYRLDSPKWRHQMWCHLWTAMTSVARSLVLHSTIEPAPSVWWRIAQEGQWQGNQTSCLPFYTGSDAKSLRVNSTAAAVIGNGELPGFRCCSTAAVDYPLNSGTRFEGGLSRACCYFIGVSRYWDSRSAFSNNSIGNSRSFFTSKNWKFISSMHRCAVTSDHKPIRPNEFNSS